MRLHFFRRLLKESSVLFWLLACASAWTSGGYVDGVVATVGRETILHSDVMQEIMPMLPSLRAQAASEEELAVEVENLFKQALEQVIEYHILHREAQTMKVEVPENEVERRLAQVREQYGSGEAFQKALEEAGQTVSAFRDRLRKQIMAVTVSMTKRRQFEREAVVSESEIAQYYQDHLDKFRYDARYKVRRIFIQVENETDARNAARDKADQLRTQIEEGADFAELARQHSDGPEAKEGGLIGWVLPDDLVEPLNSALIALEPGKLSHVLETEYGLHVLKLEEVEAAGELDYKTAATKIEPILRQQRGDERYRHWMSTLRRRNNVRVLI